MDTMREAVNRVKAGEKATAVSKELSVNRTELSILVKYLDLLTEGLGKTSDNSIEGGIQVPDCENCERLKLLTEDAVNRNGADCDSCEKVKALTSQLASLESLAGEPGLEPAAVNETDSDAMLDRVAELEAENELLRAGLPDGVTLEHLDHWSMIEVFCNKCGDISPFDIVDRWLNWSNANKALRHQLLRANEIIRNKTERITFLSSVNDQIWPLIDKNLHADLAKFEAEHGIVLPPDPYEDYPVSADDDKGGPDASGPLSHALASSDADDYPAASDWTELREPSKMATPKPSTTPKPLTPPVTVKPTPTVGTPARLSWLDRLGNWIEGN